MSSSLTTRRMELRATAGPAAAARILEPILAEVAGPDSHAVSLTLDFGAPLPIAEKVIVEAWVERATRSLIFAHGRLTTQSGDLVASGSAIFRRVAPIISPPDAHP